MAVWWPDFKFQCQSEGKECQLVQIVWRGQVVFNFYGAVRQTLHS